ncbi:MAG: carbohydrate ABC transporter permease [Defluviitoga tunisiensis]|nr:carbohydrate ABC transporter permease [Defluviitoga sp.]
MKKQRSKKKIIKRTINYLVLTALALFFIFPFLWALSTSLKTSTDVLAWPPKWIPKPATLDAYKYVISNVPFARYFINSLIITVLGIIFNVGFASLAAYPLARLKFKGRDLIFFLILLPMMIPIQGGLIVNFITILNLKLYDTYLAVVLPSAVSIFGIFIMRQNYLSIPRDLEDAARIDGCNEFQLWWKIMFPMVRPAATALSIISFAGFWNAFLWPLIVLQNENKFPLQVGLSYLNNMFEQNYRYITASLIVAALPILIFFFFTQRYFIEGYQGALKQ